MADYHALKADYVELLKHSGISPEEMDSRLELTDAVPDLLGGTRTLGTFLDALRSIRQEPFLAGAHQSYLRLALSDIEQAARSCGMEAPFPMFVGEYPTFEINVYHKAAERFF
jgi:hypothetical protein